MKIGENTINQVSSSKNVQQKNIENTKNKLLITVGKIKEAIVKFVIAMGEVFKTMHPNGKDGGRM